VRDDYAAGQLDAQVQCTPVFCVNITDDGLGGRSTARNEGIIDMWRLIIDLLLDSKAVSLPPADMLFNVSDLVGIV
jgi:hypothetical protein